MLAAGLVDAPLRAETLVEALRAARDANPRILGALSRSSASDEGVPRAQSGYMPKVTAQADASFGTDARTPSLASDQSTRSGGYSVMLSQPIFDGGRTSSAIREAAANAGAQRETARVIEQQVMLAAVTAYVDVRQDRRILRINQQNVAALEVTARAARRRKDVSEATIADVSQAEAALAGGRAELELATSTLSADEAAFEATVLHPPTALESPPSVLHLMPKDRQSAVALSEHESPQLVAALLRAESARHSIERARAQRMPSLELQTGYQRHVESPLATGETNGFVARAVVTVPIYTGGAIESDIRAAAHNHAASLQDAADVRINTRAGVAQAWARLNSARSAIKSVKQQVAANRAALAGLQAEYRVGQRSMLDILTTQQALFQSAITQERTERDLVVAAYTVLGLIGRLDPESIARPADGVRNGEADVAWTATIAAPKEASKPLKKIAQPAPPVSWTITVQKAH